jgi:hypothetical protein
MGDTRMDETEKEWMESWEACISRNERHPDNFDQRGSPLIGALETLKSGPVAVRSPSLFY